MGIYGASIWVRRRRYQNGARQPISRVMIILIRSWCKIFLIAAAVAILIDAGVPALLIVAASVDQGRS